MIGNIHPMASVAAQAIIGDGTKIWHYAQVRENAIIGKNCTIGNGVYIDHHVIIGDNCKIQNGANIYYPAIIGDGVFIGPGAILTNDKYPRAINDDGTLKEEGDWEPQGVKVMVGASIGAGAIIMPGVTIGRWAVVGAGSVVTKDVLDYVMVYGVPAEIKG